MLREFFLSLSRAHWAQDLITRLPIAWQMASRFISGTTTAEAIKTIQGLNARGLTATLDFLGESVTNPDEATRAADEYLCILEQIAASGVRAHISLKLTQFGLDLDPALCERNLRRVVEKAQAVGTFVCVDMESSAHTDRTLAAVNAVRRDFDNLGTVLQAYLYRTEQDLIALADAGTRIRLCKGAYQEPADRAFPRKADVDANFVKLTRLLLDRSANAPALGDGRTPPLAAIATHDEKMIAAARDYAAEKRIPRDQFEFQMLHGVRRDLQERLAREGYGMRVYVPYGTHWYPYFMRRLAERPANVWFFVSNYFKN